VIDTHAHIDTSVYDDDREIVINRAIESGLEAIIIPAIEPAGFDNLIELTKSRDTLYCGIGIHPHNANDVNDGNLDRINELARNPKVCAIGEIGLDYYYDFAPKDIQKEAFRRQIKIAKESELPIIVHNRESDDDLMNILKDEQDGKLKGVLHCFSSTKEFLESAIKLGFHVSFTGNISFKKVDLNDVVKATPLDRLLLETDSPYMTPVPNRGKRNEPAFVKYVAQKIAEIKSIPLDEVIQMTTLNAKRLFKLSVITLFLAVISGFTAIPSFSKDNDFDDPYIKGLGIGFNLGTNTIVETQYYKNLQKSISYEGIVFYGGAISYSLIDYLVLEAGYNYSKNTKIVQTSEDLEGPNIHQVVELTAQWIANPHSRINFFGTTGLSMFWNTLNVGRGYLESKDAPIGFNIGIGLKINIPIKGVGLINPVLEWRINWAPSRVSTFTYWDRREQPVEIESNKFFSMPRLAIMFYPEALYFLNLNY